MVARAASKVKISRTATEEEPELDLTASGGIPFAPVPGLTQTKGPGSVASPEFVSIGFGSYIAINRVLSIISPDSAPVRRFLREARDRNLLVDATFGRKTKAVLLLDTGHVLTAALQPETLVGRFENQKTDGKNKDKSK